MVQEGLSTSPSHDPLSDSVNWDDSTYHCPMLLSMHYDHVDPSLALAFFCQTAEDFKSLSDDLKQVASNYSYQNNNVQKVFPASNPPLFEQLDKRPHYWPPFEPYTGVKAKIEMKGSITDSFFLMKFHSDFDDMGAPNYTIDEDFTVLDIDE